MGESETGPTLSYHTPDVRPRVRPFWSIFLGSCVAGFFVTHWAIEWISGRPSRDGGVWFLEAFGIVVTTVLVAIFKGGFPRARVFAPWLALVLGLFAPLIGLLIYSFFPWG